MIYDPYLDDPYGGNIRKIDNIDRTNDFLYDLLTRSLDFTHHFVVIHHLI